MNLAFTDDTDLQEMVSYRRNVTGIDHTVFISPKGNARHVPHIKVAVDPPDSIDPRSVTVSIGLTANGTGVARVSRLTISSPSRCSRRGYSSFARRGRCPRCSSIRP
jgi:hypothetical protein